MGFAPPPRSGFAFIAAPERRSARVPSYELGGVRRICHVAIFLKPRWTSSYAKGLKLWDELRRKPSMRSSQDYASSTHLDG
jgi:hypothetical protein